MILPVEIPENSIVYSMSARREFPWFEAFAPVLFMNERRCSGQTSDFYRFSGWNIRPVITCACTRISESELRQRPGWGAIT